MNCWIGRGVLGYRLSANYVVNTPVSCIFSLGLSCSCIVITMPSWSYVEYISLDCVYREGRFVRQNFHSLKRLYFSMVWDVFASAISMLGFLMEYLHHYWKSFFNTQVHAFMQNSLAYWVLRFLLEETLLLCWCCCGPDLKIKIKRLGCL